MEARENTEFESEEKELKFKERRCNNSLHQTNLCQSKLAHKKKEERLMKGAKHKAYKYQVSASSNSFEHSAL